ncbi:hypothetical protein COC96_19795 [Bacillus cereus]|nr:hypothetical protein COC96_19795 [Bacillus cereus]
MNIPFLGLILQIIFFLSMTLFSFVRVYFLDNFSVYPVALVDLFIGLTSFICGLYGVIKKIKPFLSLFVIISGLFICFFFIFVYLLPEAGTPPAIPWLYS